LVLAKVAGDDFAADVVGLSFGRKVIAEFAGDGMFTARGLTSIFRSVGIYILDLV
jgi:hypothetical protein